MNHTFLRNSSIKNQAFFQRELKLLAVLHLCNFLFLFHDLVHNFDFKILKFSKFSDFQNSHIMIIFFVVKIHFLFYFFVPFVPELFGFFKALSILELLHWKVWKKKKRLKPSNFKRWWTLGSELFYIYNVPDSRITHFVVSLFYNTRAVLMWCLFQKYQMCL